MNPIITLCLLAFVAVSANAVSHSNWRILNTKGGLEHVVENVQAPVEALKTPQVVQSSTAYQQTLPTKGYLPEQESFLQAPQPILQAPVQQTSFVQAPVIQQQQPRLVYYSAPVYQQSYPIKGYQPIQENFVQQPMLSVPIQQQANFLPELIQQQPRVVQQSVVAPVFQQSLPVFQQSLPVLQQSLPVKGYQQEVRSTLVQEPLVQQSVVASQAPLVGSAKV